MKTFYSYLTRLLCVCAFAFVGIGSAGAVEKTVTYAIATTNSVTINDGDAPNGSSATYTQTYGTVCQHTSGNNATMTLSGYNGCTITKIQLSTKSNSKGGSGSFTVTAGTTKLLEIDGAYNTTWSNHWSTSAETITPTMLNDSYVIGDDEKVVLHLNATANSLYWYSATITYTEAEQGGITKIPTSLSFSSETAEYTLRQSEPFIAPTLITNPEGLAVSYSSSNIAVATVDETTGAVSFVADGKTTITASYAGDETHQAAQDATYVLTVIDPNKTSWTISKQGFESVTGSLDDNISYTTAQNSAGTAPGVYSNCIRLYQASATTKGGSITISAKTGYVLNTVTITSGSTYSSTKVSHAIDGGEESEQSSLAKESEYTVSDLNARSIEFICHGSDKNSRLDVAKIEVTYSAVSATAPVEPTISPNGGMFLGSQTVTLSCETEGATIYYTTDGTDPDANANEYTAPFVLRESATVKAVAIKDGESSFITTAAFTAVVLAGEGEGTVDAPYDVLRAIDVYEKKDDFGLNIEGIYVKGIVSKVLTTAAPEGTLNYNISNDGTTTATQFQFYNGKGLNSADFKDASDITVGDIVIGVGNITKYGSIYEFAADNHLVKHLKVCTLSIADMEVENGNVVNPEIITNNSDEYTVTYSTSNSEIVSVSADGKTLTAVGAGTATITATIAETANYQAQTTTFDVKVKVASGTELEFIVIEGKLAKTDYYIGETFDYSGLTVKAIYSDESIVDVTADCEWSNSIGETFTEAFEDFVTVTATYGGMSESTNEGDIVITVKDKLTGITLSGDYQTTFNLGEEFNNDNMVVTATYLSGDEDATGFEEITGYDMTTVGTQTVTVSFEDIGETVTATYEITVVDPFFETTTNDVTDVITSDMLAAKSTTYMDFSNVTDKSSAVYAGKTAKKDSGSIQINSTNPYGIVSTQSGGKLKSVSVTFNNGTSSDRIVDIYGNNVPYTSGKDLYAASTDGDKLSSDGLVYNSSTPTVKYDLTDSQDYSYVGLRSKSGALYLDKVEITWETTETIAPVKVSSVGWATFYSGANNVIVPEGVEAYTYTVNGDALEKSHTFVPGDIINAGTAVVVKADNQTYDFVVTTKEGEAVTDNLLRGTDYNAMTTGGSKYYMLSLNAANEEGSVGFYWGAADGGAFENKAHKAYLALPASATNAPMRFLFDDTAAGIENVSTQGNDVQNCYNLNGQRVNNPAKGLYIINGKKIIK